MSAGAGRPLGRWQGRCRRQGTTRQAGRVRNITAQHRACCAVSRAGTACVRPTGAASSTAVAPVPARSRQAPRRGRRRPAGPGSLPPPLALASRHVMCGTLCIACLQVRRPVCRHQGGALPHQGRSKRDGVQVSRCATPVPTVLNCRHARHVAAARCCVPAGPFVCAPAACPLWLPPHASLLPAARVTHPRPHRFLLVGIPGHYHAGKSISFAGEGQGKEGQLPDRDSPWATAGPTAYRRPLACALEGCPAYIRRAATWEHKPTGISALL